MLNRYIALDLETTGLDSTKDKIVEIGMVKIENGKIIDTYQTLVQPNCPLSVIIKRLTGIDDQMLINAPSVSVVLPEVLKFIGQNKILGHNVLFDCNFLEVALKRPFFGDYYDTLELSRIVFPAFKSHRLGDLCAYLSIPLGTTHRALDDAIYSYKLYEELKKKLNTFDSQKLAYLASLLKEANSFWAEIIEKMALNSIGGSSCPKPFSFSEDAYDNNEADKDNKDLGFVNEDDLMYYFSLDGPLKEEDLFYKVREPQLSMTKKVADALNKNKILVAEAGTGTGKSMAYLVPALLWANSGGNKVVVSTRTIPLQEQLWEKDIPFLQRVLKLNIPIALAKGRQNYLCLRKWQSAFSDPHKSSKEALFYARILLWLDETVSADKGELNLCGQEIEFWSGICGDSESCLGSKCVWFNKRCYISKIKRKLEKSKIIVTNHSLLFANLKADKKILPEYGPLIIDEAHHLEDAAMEQLGTISSKNDLTRWLLNTGKILIQLQGASPPFEKENFQKILSCLKEERVELKRSLNNFFDLLRKVFIQKEVYEGRIIRRLQKNILEKEAMPIAEFDNLVFLWNAFLNNFNAIFELILAYSKINDSWEKRLGEIERIISSGLEKINNLKLVFGASDKEKVYWIEIIGESEHSNLILHSAPLKVDEDIYNGLFSEEKPVILTSATLAVNGSFQYFANNIGLNNLDDEKTVWELMDSPFDYEKQALLTIVKGLPSQGEYGNETYLEDLCKILLDYLKLIQGKTLVLFTSHRLLKKAYNLLKIPLEKEDICLLGHNIDGGRWRLLEEFKKTPRSVIFGTSSFWEGVDIKGEALGCVIIVKLPFLSPNMPIVEGKLSYLKSKGINPFANYSLPKAVLKFKQGFGRLIRSESDKGVVIVLDDRLVTKKYGSNFLNSLPLKNYFQGNKDKIFEILKRYLKE